MVTVSSEDVCRSIRNVKFINESFHMRCLVMFITALCLLFLLKLKWPKNKSVISTVPSPSFLSFLSPDPYPFPVYARSAGYICQCVQTIGSLLTGAVTGLNRKGFETETPEGNSLQGVCGYLPKKLKLRSWEMGFLAY